MSRGGGFFATIASLTGDCRGKIHLGTAPTPGNDCMRGVLVGWRLPEPSATRPTACKTVEETPPQTEIISFTVSI